MMTWTWPDRIALLNDWAAIDIAFVFVALATWLVARRSKSFEVTGLALAFWLLVLVFVSLGGEIARLFHRDTAPQAFKTAFYLLYGCAAVMAVMVLPRIVAEIRDMGERLAQAWRRPNIRRLAARGRAEPLWNACLYCDWSIFRRSCFYSDWVGDWSIAREAVKAVSALGQLQGLFEMLEKSQRQSELTRIVGWLGERPAPGAAAGLFWLARRRSDYQRSAALGALQSQDVADVRAAADWGLLTDLARGLDESNALSAIVLSRRTDDPRSQEVLAAAANSRIRSVQWQAVSALAEAGDPRAVDPLLGLLHERGWEGPALEALVKVPDPRAAAPVAALLPTLSPAHAGVALALLEEVGNSTTAGAIVPLLGNPECARLAARVLARLGWRPGNDADAIQVRIANGDWNGCADVGAPAVGPLVDALAAYPSARAAIVEALGRIGDGRAAAAVAGIVDERAPAELVQAAVVSLGTLGDEGRAALVEMAATRPPSIRQAALAALSDRSPDAAMDVARRLVAGDGPLSADVLAQVAALGDEAGVPLLCDACREAGDARVESAIVTIVRLGGAASLADVLAGKASNLPFLMDLVTTRGSEVAAAAAAVLKHMPAANLSRLLLNRLQQPPRPPAETMIGLLSGVAPQAAGGLVSLLQTSRDRQILTIAATVLAEAGDARAAQAIVGAIKRDRLNVSDVRAALARLGSAAVDGLSDLLPGAGIELITLLGEIGDARAAGPIGAVMRSGDEYRVGACADALDAMGWQPSADEPSAWYLAYRGRIEECRQLGAIGVPALAFAVAHFEVRSWDDHPGDQRLHEEAIEALGGCGDPGALDVLAGLLRTGARPSREAAARGLVRLAKTTTFTEEQRVRLLAARNYVTGHTDTRGPHTDYARHFDKSTHVPSHDCHDSSTAHEDHPNPVNFSRFADIKHKDAAGRHTDEGLSMPFPL